MIVFSTVVTPGMSTGVLFCKAVMISCGFGWGSSQNGQLSLLSSARKVVSAGRFECLSLHSSIELLLVESWLSFLLMLKKLTC